MSLNPFSFDSLFSRARMDARSMLWQIVLAILALTVAGASFSTEAFRIVEATKPVWLVTISVDTGHNGVNYRVTFARVNRVIYVGF